MAQILLKSRKSALPAEASFARLRSLARRQVRSAVSCLLVRGRVLKSVIAHSGPFSGGKALLCIDRRRAEVMPRSKGATRRWQRQVCFLWDRGGSQGGRR